MKSTCLILFLLFVLKSPSLLSQQKQLVCVNAVGFSPLSPIRLRYEGLAFWYEHPIFHHVSLDMNVSWFHDLIRTKNQVNIDGWGLNLGLRQYKVSKKGKLFCFRLFSNLDQVNCRFMDTEYISEDDYHLYTYARRVITQSRQRFDLGAGIIRRYANNSRFWFEWELDFSMRHRNFVTKSNSIIEVFQQYRIYRDPMLFSDNERNEWGFGFLCSFKIGFNLI